jgi:hypothetical protein
MIPCLHGGFGVDRVFGFGAEGGCSSLGKYGGVAVRPGSYSRLRAGGAAVPKYLSISPPMDS